MSQMRWLLACFTVMASSAQSPSLLDRVKARAQENLRGLPDYTCTEVIQRSLRGPRERRLRHWDTVRVNVAYVGGKELFGKPGTGRVDDADLEKLLGGTNGNGQFAIFVRSIFLEDRASFGPPRRATLDGKPAYRVDYAVPLARSGFLIRSSVGKAIVGYAGRLWVARDSLDLMRLLVSADKLPAALEMKSDATTIDYGRVPIAGTAFLLPVRSTYDGKDIFGAEDRNIMTFERCRKYVGESVLKFEESAPPSPNK